jgi:ribose/xylose/arabinose/galactoside ABC-type transport system permease subunit
VKAKEQIFESLSSVSAMLRKAGAVWVVVLLLYLVSGLISPGMFQFGQIINILQVAAFLGVVATGQTLAVLSGGIDLSVAGVVTMANILSTSIMAGHAGNAWIAITACLLVSAVVGMVNGLLITAVRVTPLVATLGMNSILFGAALVYTGGAPHGGISSEFAVFGQGHLVILPVSAICWLTIAFSMAWLMRRTIFGRQLYAVGANPTAARAMGIPVDRTVIVAYILSSILAMLGGLLLTSYIGSPSLGIGDQFLLTSIAATVVGGTALAGGTGSIVGTVGGTLFITELNSFTTVVRVSTGTQFVLQGAVIALSVLLYRLIGFNKTSS